MNDDRLRELVALSTLALEVRPLREMDSWEPVGTLLEGLYGAIQGHDGITSNDIVRLRSMTRIWVSLHPQVREFYSAATKTPPRYAPQERAVNRALWHVLGGHVRATLDPTTYALVRGVWYDRHGSHPPMELAPKLHPHSFENRG